MSNPSRTAARPRARTALQRAAFGVGVVFLLVGALGFLPGVTTGYDHLALGHHSGARLFGVFQVSTLHNGLHLASGVLGLALARSTPAAAAYLVCGGLLYLALVIYGYLVPARSPANFLPLNPADDLLHLAASITMIGLGLGLARRVPVPGPSTADR